MTPTIKRKILFLNDFYYPKPMPNAICLHRVAQELIKSGFEIHVIAYKRKGLQKIAEYEGVKIHYINMRLFYILRTYGEDNIQKKLGKVAYSVSKPLNKFAKLIWLSRFPMASPVTINRYYKKASNLHEQYKFDAVISLFNPDDTLFAGVRLKKKFPELKLGAYILDSLIFLSGKKKLPRFLRNKLSWKFEKMIYENFDEVYNMETHRIHHLSEKYDPYRNKLVFLDTPLFRPRQLILKKKLFDSNKKHLLYMGTLFKTFRNPEYLYRLFIKINDQNEYNLHFYTRGDCESTVLNYQKESDGAVVRHGYLEHSEIDNIYANADYLINLGVSNSTNISSKIFDYMAIGKPIIHLYYYDDDVNLRYFKKYDLALTIKMDENLFIENEKKLKAFLIKTYDLTLNSNTLINNFKKNLPEYTALHFKQLAGISNNLQNNKYKNESYHVHE